MQGNAATLLQIDESSPRAVRKYDRTSSFAQLIAVDPEVHRLRTAELEERAAPLAARMFRSTNLRTHLESDDADLPSCARPRDDAIVVGMRAVSRVDLERVRRAVVRVRGQNVMLDSDLAALYAVDVKVLNQAVKRNRDRFPSDFMLQLTRNETTSLRSQIVTLDGGRGRHRKYLPKAFTEQGVAMLSSVLRSQRAVRMNIEIMRVFVQFRQIFGANDELARKLDALERKYDGQFRAVFQAIRELMTPSKPPRRTIGFSLRSGSREDLD